MRINQIQVYSYKPNFTGQNKTVKSDTLAKSELVTPVNVGLGVTALTAMGAATFSIIRNKKAPAKLVDKVREQSTKIVEKTAEKLEEVVSRLKKDYTELPKHENLENFKVTKLEVKKTACQRPENVRESLEGVEKLIFVSYGDGTGRVNDRTYFKDKLFEVSVHENIFKKDDLPDTKQVVRYNFAYENGKIAGVAKQAIFNHGDVYGIFHGQDWEPFPLLVKMKGEKEFKAADCYTINELMKQDTRFDPFNF